MAPRPTLVLAAVIAIAALTAPAVAQVAVTRRPTTLRALAARSGKKGGGGSCTVGAPTMKLEATPASTGTDPYTGKPIPDYPFSEADAAFFINNQAKPRLLNHLSTTFDCVDSRAPSTDGFNNRLGTPGGDLGEVITAIAKYCELTGVSCTRELVKEITFEFINKVASPSRPAYLHTSEEKLNKVLTDVKAKAGLAKRPSALPQVAPSDATLREIYLESLAEGSHQGCGHIRLMIDQPADYGLNTPELEKVPVYAVMAYYEYWWATPLGSPQRRRVDFSVLQGKLEGDAVIIINAATTEGTCSNRSPSITHAFWGGQAFIYNGAAAEDFRSVRLGTMLANFAKAKGHNLNKVAFVEGINDLHELQLGATLTYLEPAKWCPILSATY